ncbi:MAG: site-specific integrase [Patescibacteria group bacterium]|nr:site-specific integrase [Patescibacteria group bacterium]
MLFTEAFKKFLNWLEIIKNKSPNTLEQYNRHLLKFEDYINNKGIDISKFKVEKINLDIAE